MKTLLITLLISLSFSSFSFADHSSAHMTSQSLSPEIQQLSSEATQYMSAVYTDTTGESIQVMTKEGLELLQVDAARDILEATFNINSSDSLESFIQETNTLTPFSSPVFWRSKCCQCGDCTNF